MGKTQCLSQWQTQQTNRFNYKGGIEIGKKDELRHRILVLIEAYDIAAYPPAITYGPAGNMQREAGFEDILSSYNRERLLIAGIDAKYAVNGILDKLPKKRAEVLYDWILHGRACVDAKYTYMRRLSLKYDRLALRAAMRGDAYWKKVY